MVGVELGGRGFIPVKDSRFQQGDVAHFILLTDAVDRFDTLLEPLAE